MRKIVAGFAASLDGYIEGLHGEYDWILVDKEIDFAAQMQRFDTFLFGRKSYEMMLRMGNKKTPGITNYVFSNTLENAAENYTLVKGDIAEQIKLLKNTSGKDIAVFGGAGLLTSLLDLHVVDEISICMIPVLLGQGKSMINAVTDKVWLELREHKIYGNGSVQLTYNVIYHHP
jgi:dihydrofolate reductase